MDASTSPVSSNHLLVIPSVIHADTQHPSFSPPSSEDRSRITGSCQVLSGRMVHAMAAPGGRSLSAGKAAHVCFEQGLQHHNAARPHNALGYPPPAPEARARLPLARPRRLAVNHGIAELTSGLTNHWGQVTHGGTGAPPPTSGPPFIAGWRPGGQSAFPSLPFPPWGSHPCSRPDPGRAAVSGLLWSLMTIRPSVSYRGTANRWPRKPVPPEGRTRAARPKHHERRQESGARGICALLRDHAFAVQPPNAPSRWRPPALH